MIGLIFVIIMLALSFRIVGVVLSICGKLLGVLLSCVGFIILGGLAIGVFGIALMIIPIIIIVGISAIIRGLTIL